mmetsp:Transcript_65703/g.207923  ORF Transcript_65703/g.207923 Transcript_65703/m.207923 type:complete len:396 (+) Transcript_65703:1068-2255(+)
MASSRSSGLQAIKDRLEDLFFAFLDRAEVCCDLSLKVIGPIFVCGALFMIGYATYVMFVHVMVTWGERAVAGFLVFNVLWNYVLTVVRDPGRSPEVPLPADVETGQAELAYRQMGYRRFCHRCRVPKPPLSHHCSACGKCVLKMDHHCPWVHNCVGFYNYRTFYLFVMYTWLYSLFVLCEITEPLHVRNPWDISLVMRRYRYNVHPLYACVLALSIGISLSLLLAFHTYLVLTAQGTIDFYRNLHERGEAKKRGEAWANPWDLGARKNWCETFDVSGTWWWWALWAAPRLRRRGGSGTSFPNVYGRDDLRRLCWTFVRYAAMLIPPVSPTHYLNAPATCTKTARAPRPGAPTGRPLPTRSPTRPLPPPRRRPGTPEPSCGRPPPRRRPGRSGATA